MASVYSVFYELDGIFDICRTDFLSAGAAGYWVNCKLLPAGNARLHFVLRDGQELVQGEVIDSSAEFFSDCMRFAKKIDAGKALSIYVATPFCYN